MSTSRLDVTEQIVLGDECEVDPGVVVGLLTGRRIDDLSL